MNFHFFDPSLSSTKVLEVLEKTEGYLAGAYWDSAKSPNATIGIGFNLEATSAVVAAGGFTNDYLRLVLEERFGTSGINMEQFVADFTNPTTGIGSIRPSTSQVKNNKALYNNQLQGFLDGLVTNNLLPGQAFQSFQVTLGQSRDVINQ